jgi:fucose permease
LLGVAWPTMRADFSRPLDAVGLLLLASMLGYLMSSFFSGKVMARLGVGGLLAASCLITGSSLIGYTLAPAWWAVVALGVMAGLGAGAIDAGINTYIASEHGEGLMQWLHASFGVGVTLGPIIMTTGLNLFHTWRPGYLLVGAAQILLAITFALTARMWRRQPAPDQPAESRRLIDYRTPLMQTLLRPATWVSITMFFIYTGVEMCLGLWAYTLLTESRGVAPQIAGLVAGSYWGMFTVGRILAGVYTRRAPVAGLVRVAMLTALFGAGLVWWNPAAWVGVLGVAITGFAVAPIFPGLVSGTHQRVGLRHAANTIGMQISAAGLGGALVPGLAGVLARRFSLEVIPAYLFGCCAVLLALYLFALNRAPAEGSAAD